MLKGCKKIRKRSKKKKNAEAKVTPQGHRGIKPFKKI